MPNIISILFVLTVVFTGCSNSKAPGQSSRKSHNGERILAWNEDTVMTCQFVLKKDYKFTYLISTLDTNGNISQKVYNGTVKLSEDKIFLLYNNDIRPSNVQSFLIKEITGDYLIQDYTDGKKRMYLRIAYPSRWR